VILDTCVNTCTCVYTIWWHHCSGSFSNGFEEYGAHALVMCCLLYKPQVIKKIQLLHRGSYMYMCVPSASPPGMPVLPSPSPYCTSSSACKGQTY